jgi:hypothetical protein
LRYIQKEVGYSIIAYLFNIYSNTIERILNTLTALI